MKAPKVLVTGGAGYIGIHTVVELVHAGMEPVIVDDLSRSDVRLISGAEKILGRKIIFHKINCLDHGALYKVMKDHPEISQVIHFAAFKSVSESVQKPLLYYKNNIDTLLTLLDVMKDLSVNELVFSSSCTVYGQPDQIPVTESAPFKAAESAYGASKQMCERILEDEVKASPSLKVVSLRYFNPIGAHPSGLIGELPLGIPSNLVPFITQTAIGKRNELTVFGGDYNTPDGSCLRDFIHVVDLAEAHVKAIDAMKTMTSRFEAVNVGSGIPVSVLELLSAFKRSTGVDLKYSMGPRRPGDVEKVYADPSKSFQFLNWKTKSSIDQALKDAWNWEKKLKDATN
ncbi:MAG: UDP-glucose 4-epimerase GalE [Cyclobacteriaceae bacterium]|nr:UDP-glucose 4-epimerase GalE [Cyclobacteriaceae bacterium]